MFCKLIDDNAAVMTLQNAALGVFCHSYMIILCCVTCPNDVNLNIIRKGMVTEDHEMVKYKRLQNILIYRNESAFLFIWLHENGYTVWYCAIQNTESIEQLIWLHWMLI